MHVIMDINLCCEMHQAHFEDSLHITVNEQRYSLYADDHVTRTANVLQRAPEISYPRPSHYSTNSSFIATALTWANTRCPGFSPKVANDFLVMLAISGDPMSNKTSTDD